MSVSKLRHVALDAGYIFSDRFDRRRQLRFAASGYEDVSPFTHELLRRRQTDAAIAAGHQRDFFLKLTHDIPPGTLAKSSFYALTAWARCASPWPNEKFSPGAS
jgi:hypothetical protein